MITQITLAAELGTEYYRPRVPLMPPTKLEAFHEQFPWAKQYATGPISQVYVSRVEPDILNHGNGMYLRIDMYVPGILFDERTIGDRWFPVELYLLDKDGEALTIEKEQMVYRCRHWYQCFDTGKMELCKIKSKVTEGTLGETLKLFEQKAKDIRFVLSYCERTKALIVYKIPEGLSLREWVDRQRVLEREQFQKACSDIDAEATASQRETEKSA